MIQTVVAYAAAVFVVLQVADLTFEAIGFPGWSYRFLVILSIVGFPVTAVSAWIFDLRSGEIERTPATAEGRVRRAPPIVAVAVVGATVAVAGLATWLIREGGPRFGPVDADLIAVAPFRIASSDASLGYLREGAVDLLAAKLTESPRVVDPRTLFSEWRRLAGSVEADLGEDEVAQLAAGLGAGRVLLGSIVGSPSSLTLTASLRDVEDGRVVAETTIDGSADSLTAMIDGLAGRLLGAQAGTPVESVTSSSIDAVRAYLEGRTAYRRGAFLEAAGDFARAVELDSTFATAALSFIDANGMVLSATDDSPYRRRAWAHRGRLSNDDQLYLRMVIGRNYPEANTLRDQIDFQADVTERLPNRAEAWYQFGDQLFHYGHEAGLTDELLRAEAAFRRAIDLDPGFTNAHLHLNWTYQLLDDPRWLDTPVPGLPRDLPELTENSVLSVVTEPGFRDGLPERLAPLVDDLHWNSLMSLPFEALLAFGSGGGTSRLNRVAEAATVRAIEISANPAQLRASLDARWNFLANLQRWDDALRIAERIAETGESGRRDADRLILEAVEVWGADPPGWPSAAAFARLVDGWESARGEVATLEAADIQTACVLGLHASRVAPAPLTREIAEGMRSVGPVDGAITRDPGASRRTTCALLLEAHLAELSDSDRGALAELRAWLDPGPPGARMRMIANLRAARMWEARGDAETAWDHARRDGRSPLGLAFQRAFVEAKVRTLEARGERLEAESVRERMRAFDWPPAVMESGG